jgi:hypothetical protein
LFFWEPLACKSDLLRLRREWANPLEAKSKGETGGFAAERKAIMSVSAGSGRRHREEI